ncbi:hemocyte protein-glutamine gamma-glutamyltransferase-like, partial [Elysia marginata]
MALGSSKVVVLLVAVVVVVVVVKVIVVVEGVVLAVKIVVVVVLVVLAAALRVKIVLVVVVVVEVIVVLVVVVKVVVVVALSGVVVKIVVRVVVSLVIVIINIKNTHLKQGRTTYCRSAHLSYHKYSCDELTSMPWGLRRIGCGRRRGGGAGRWGHGPVGPPAGRGRDISCRLPGRARWGDADLPRYRPSCGGFRVRFFTYGCDGRRRDEEDMSSAAPEPDVKTLTVKSCDFNIKENGKAHNTGSYEISSSWKDPQLVVRRGQPFNIDLKFNREYDPAQDDLKLVFEVGDKPNPTKGTLVEFVLSDKDKPKEWGAKIVSKNGSNLRISVFTPPTVYVGKWEFSLEVVKKDQATVDVYTYEHDDPIYILFNPWCKDDSVYLDDAELVREYILNETGKIYCGSCRNITSRPWNFGQFESCVLDCALYLLDAGNLAWTSRGNPVQVVRKLSAMVNSNDDGGVLVGNWSGEYSDGKSPLSWTGSVGILEKYWEYKKPVKFGQCWVFSGVTTTVCRALGIPTRSVTNFASAHDTDGSVTIDVIFDEEGNRDDYMTDDSI